MIVEAESKFVNLFEKDLQAVRQQYESGLYELAASNAAKLAEFDSSNINLQKLQCKLAQAQGRWSALDNISRRAKYFMPFDDDIKALREEALTKTDRLDLIEKEKQIADRATLWAKNEVDYLSFKGEEIRGELGVLYIAMDEKYVIEAAESVKSLKAQHPDVPCALITAVNADFNGIFDDIIPVKRDMYFKYYFEDPARMASIKVKYLRLSPYRKTLYLDSDTYVVRSLDEIFNGLEHSDFMFFEVPNAKHTKIPGEKASEIFLRGLSTPYICDSGVIAFRKSRQMDYLFDLWFAKYIETQSGSNRWSGNWGEGINDQAVLNKLIASNVFSEVGLRVFLLQGWRYNSKEFSFNMLKKHQMLDEVHILHMNDISKKVAKVGKDSWKSLSFVGEGKEYQFPLVIEENR